MLDSILKGLEQGSDWLMNWKRYPSASHLPRPPVIAHRGAWNLTTHRENSLAAFERAKSLGMDGIEFDVHFTRDQIPVVSHDPGLARVFGVDRAISDLDFAELRRLAPGVPALERVLALEGLHLMVEIKTPLDARRISILEGLLTGRAAGRDFHLLALDPNLVRVTPKFPGEAWLLVGQVNLKALIEVSIARGYGGVAGHYLGMTAKHIARLHAHGQKAGAGFLPTLNLCERERARGIDWIFTNSAEKLGHG